jgi:hypothetical protein
MGYTVLYIAFGAVALWLLAEVLLQHKARLCWRALALAGFLGVVIGVVLPSLIVIILGVAGFGTGQALVTLSHRRGFTGGWTVAGRRRPSRRRRARNASAPATRSAAEPAAEVTGAAARPQAAPGGTAPGEDDEPAFDVFGVPYSENADVTQAYWPEPLHEDTGEYGIYSDRPTHAGDPYLSGRYAQYGGPGQVSEGGPEQQWQPSASYGQPLGDGYGPVPEQQFTGNWPDSPYPGFPVDYQGPQPDQWQGQSQWYGAPPDFGYPHHQEQQNPHGYQYGGYGGAGGGGYQDPAAGPWPEQYPEPGHVQPADQAYIPHPSPHAHDQAQPADPWGSHW